MNSFIFMRDLSDRGDQFEKEFFYVKASNANKTRKKDMTILGLYMYAPITNKRVRECEPSEFSLFSLFTFRKFILIIPSTLLASTCYPSGVLVTPQLSHPSQYDAKICSPRSYIDRAIFSLVLSPSRHALDFRYRQTRHLTLDITLLISRK